MGLWGRLFDFNSVRLLAESFVVRMRHILLERCQLRANFSSWYSTTLSMPSAHFYFPKLESLTFLALITKTKCIGFV
jgi:hypothetical protein